MSRLTHSHILTWIFPDTSTTNRVTDSVTEMDPLNLLSYLNHAKHTTLILGTTHTNIGSNSEPQQHHIRIKNNADDFLPIFNGNTETFLDQPGIYRWSAKHEQLVVMLDQDQETIQAWLKENRNSNGNPNLTVIAPEGTSIPGLSNNYHFYPGRPMIKPDALTLTLNALNLQTRPEGDVLRVWSDLDPVYARESFELAFANNLFNEQTLKSRLSRRLMSDPEIRSKLFANLNAVGAQPLPCYTS